MTRNRKYTIINFVLASATLAAVFACDGATTVTFGSAMEVEINGEIRQFAQNETFNAPDGPYVYKMRPVLSEGQRTFAVKRDTAFIYPVRGDGNWVRVSLPDDGSSVTLKGIKVKTVYYVDAEHGNDDWDGTADYEHRDEPSGKGPKLSLKAVNNVVASGTDSSGYPIVIAAPGVYSNGVTTTSGSEQVSCGRRLRIWSTVGYIAAEGPDRTFIVGAPDPTTGGCGPDAVGGVYVLSGVYPFVQGFTITGCYTPASISKNSQKGAAFCSAAWTDAQLLDCVVSNNFAVQCSATCMGLIQRTRIVDNLSTNYIAMYSTFVSCVIAGNRITVGNRNYDSDALLDNINTCHFCTFDLHNALNASGRIRLENSNANIYGSIAYGLTDKSRTANANWKDSKALDYPVFADAQAGDYRLGMLSPAIDAVSYDGMTVAQRRYMVSDIDGRMPVVHNGMARLGAVWNEPPLPVAVLNASDSGMFISGGSEGTNVVKSADEITVTATRAAVRPFVGFEVNGEMVPYAGTSYTFTPSLTEGSVTEVKAVYSSDWYVDCVNGNDTDSGAFGHPKQTIRSATTNAVSGDVIHVAPGTYGALEGTQKWPDDTSAIGTRVVIPAGVTVESTGGAKSTFIVGEASPEPAVTEGWLAGIGPGAVRCVAANAGATLRGFTLTGGYTHASTASLEQDRYASAFYSSGSPRAAIEDCIVSNNVASSRTMNGGTVRRCLVVGNTGAASGVDGFTGAAGANCAWYGSVIAGNRGNATVWNPVVFENCTIGAGNIWNDNGASATALTMWGGGNKAIVNCAILAGGCKVNESGKFISCTNCLIHEGAINVYLKRENAYNTIFTNTTGLQVDSEYRPILGQFAGIDKGDAAYSTEALGDIDILGTPRILNGAIDIGAVEYDWRPEFAAELGRCFTITYASPSVTTNATGGLLVVDGEVAGKVNSARPYEIAFDVTAGGLSVYVGDELVGRSSGTGEQSINFRVKDASDEIRLVVEAPGSVVLKKFVGTLGFVIRYM